LIKDKKTNNLLKKPAKGGMPAKENIKAENEKAITGLFLNKLEKSDKVLIFK